MSEHETIAVIVRQYGGMYEPGINWTWCVFPDNTKGHAAFQECCTRFPAMDHRGYCAIGFRYKHGE